MESFRRMKKVIRVDSKNIDVFYRMLAKKIKVIFNLNIDLTRLYSLHIHSLSTDKCYVNQRDV